MYVALCRRDKQTANWSGNGAIQLTTVVVSVVSGFQQIKNQHIDCKTGSWGRMLR